MKNYRVAIALSVLLLTLVGVAYWDEQQTKKDEVAKAQENRVFTIKSDDVVRIGYSEPSKNANFVLTKTEGKWQLSGDIAAAADPTIVEGFLKTLIDYKFEKVVGESKDKWDDFGVVQPQRIITIADSSGKSEQVFVGSQAPVGYNAVFRTDDSGKVYVGSQYLITSTGKTAQEFRDKSIPSVESAQIKSFRYIVGGEQVFVAEQNSGKFSIISPSGLDSDSGEIAGFLSEVGRTKAEAFEDHATPDFVKMFTTAKAAFSFEWTTETGSKGSWNVAAVKDDFWIKSANSPTYFKISSDSLKSLRKELKDFRNRQIANFETNDVISVDVDGKVYEKKDNSYYEKDGKEIKQHIQNLVSDIAWSKADGFADAGSVQAKAIEGSPEHKVSLVFDSKASREPFLLEAWSDPKDPGKFVLRSSDAKTLLIVGRDVLSNIKQQTEPGSISGLEEQPAAEEIEIDKGS